MNFMKSFLLVCFSLTFSFCANGYVFPDNTVSITPIWPPGSMLDGYAIQAIDIFGLQNQIKIIDQPLDSFVSSPGIVGNTDSVVQAVQKISATLPNAYTGIHITSGSSSTTNLTAFQRGVIFDSSVTGKTVNLPSVSDPTVIPWVDYPFLVMGGLITSNTVGVQTGESLNNTVDGTFALTGLLSGQVRASAFTDGVEWFISQ